ncbi:MAG: Tex-like N-terminal domain-containing protein [Planctomycetia bacterium]|jgi:uncharacterized protein
MTDTAKINLQHVARAVGLNIKQVQATVELLDEGNTVPFITRYRKDQTGGLDEEQIRSIQSELVRMRQLAERKQTILRSIESQGKLTEELAKKINVATTTRRLEDLYLPFKPKKQTLATAAREKGLDLLAEEILSAAETCTDLEKRAADFVDEEKKVESVADALLGAGHIIAERFSEDLDLRHKLRDMIQRSGKLESRAYADEAKQALAAKKTEESPKEEKAEEETPAATEATTEGETPEEEPVAVEAVPVETEETPVAETPADEVPEEEETAVAEEEKKEEEKESAEEPIAAEGMPAEVTAPAEEASPEDKPSEGAEATETDVKEAVQEEKPSPEAAEAKPKSEKVQSQKKQVSKTQLRKQKTLEKRLKAFADYFEYDEDIRKIPPHRVLALNRGEKSKVIKVRLVIDNEAVETAAFEALVPEGHIHAEYLKGCARDAIARLIMPALERETRRELTEKAEMHAVKVFARNLRSLLLQPSIRDNRVLAVDPGYRSGCKLVALDQFGNVLGHDVIYLVGKSAKSDKAKGVVTDLIDRFKLTVIAIGNGTACRETEDFFAAMIENELAGRETAYVIVNEAGASVYSTSQIGREEFPEYDATVRGAVSIGRRLQDPLSELVKIDPANIGVGLYQHDVRAKHLRSSLDEVVESCVNYVGVNVNTASPALLRYVSGMNQLTARRVYEFRHQNGPFRDRSQLSEVPGVGEATFVQAAGFLKIAGGVNSLDATWIHPESYPIATKVLEKLSLSVDDLSSKEKIAQLAEQIKELDTAALAAELEVGELTLRDILNQLIRPGRDPREDLPAPVFKRGVVKIEDLEKEMELTGTVLNVVDFGVFVDIGMHDSGLVHVSQLANRFIRDPHDVVAVGDIVKVWVVEVDQDRRRVSLTMIPPGTPPEERHPHHGRGHGHGHKKPADGEQRPRGKRSGGGEKHGEGQGQGRRDQSSEGGRRERGSRDGGRQGGPRREGGRGGGGGRRGGGGPRGGRGGQRPAHRGPYEKKAQPKEVKPLSEEQKEGNAPMRSFGDLAQFYNVPVEDSKSDAKKKKKKNTKKPKAEAEPKPADEKQADAKVADEKPAEVKVAAEKPVDEKPVEAKPAETPPAEPAGDQEPTDES